RRTLPAWKSATFETLAGSTQKTGPVLFADTFTNHYDPGIGMAALKVLRSAGRDARVWRPSCCGRPLISQGLLEEARAQASKLVEALHPVAASGEKILFLEPSCLSAAVDDIPSLLRGDLQKKALEVARACVLFDEYAGSLDLSLRTG